MTTALPALNLIAEPGRRRATLDVAREIERRGFAGISVSSSFGNMSQKRRPRLGDRAHPVRHRDCADLRAVGGRVRAERRLSARGFWRSVSVRHRRRPCPAYVRMEVKPGKPTGDIRAFVEKFKSHTAYGPLPSVILATLRKRMIALAAEIAEGLVFANGSRAHMAESLGILPAAKRNDPDFFIGNRIRTCICDDVDVAKAVLRKTMAHYWAMPNYQNYWKEAGLP